MKKSLRFAAIVSGLAAVMSLLSVTPAAAQALGSSGATLADEVVAVVNNGVITARELDQRVGLISRRLQQQKVPVPPPDELRSQVLNQMVVERIQLQKAKDDGIEVSDATVQSTLQRLAAANGMTVDQYRAQLEALGVPWSTFSGDARNELILSRLREKEVDSKITVTDAEVASYIASQRGPNSGSQQDVRLEHIFVAAPQNAPQDQIDIAQKKADGLLKQALASGADFEKLARNSSEAKDAKTGGDLGFKAPGSLPADVVQAVSQLRPGQVSPNLIRVPDGFEIVRLVDRRPASGTVGASPKIVQTHVRHILLRVGEGKSESQARQQLIDIRNQIEAGGDFANFARTYSQDGSASQGGDLGWISPGETVPEFERAMSQLQDGQISQPVRTEYGYHLIQVLGRRDAEGSVQKQMDIARQAIGQRKAEQAYADWLRELRDSSYVQIKIGQPQP
ncbi:molecular chaperone SurA [Burkholderia gladioli]|jgi:peptidyl-prolyl cis-trans isomerase SurA|uniref:Chaperone SurA n=3 Tax=Burkholderia gladioli TaxID=28095 RepID=A0AB38TPM0_BURGA|nr:peptidylprolyl isomerase [Burkholderia gladioli]AEA62021.1 Parvulin-like peptidyl-prolyl isomerase [Burkholderia gladioli BSR3]KAF1063130.1 Chaperone SurA [Burkholderia gladioli]KGE09951.1 molecular chaperone SurA [Burkholderia gladioli]KVM68799.1 molecular chaperone SurA [Burkholderia gladioli]MBJ9679089.1 peptidylprolyl isomerase [Burkholderia gladioli]